MPETWQVVYHFLVHYIEREGRGPKQREIAAACFIALSSANHHLRTLEKRELIVRKRYGWRGITLVNKKPS